MRSVTYIVVTDFEYFSGAIWSASLTATAGSPAHVDEDAIGTELETVHCHFLVRDKPGMAFVDRAAFQCFERALDAPPRCPRDGVLARLDGLHVDSDRAPPMVTP